MKVEGNRPVGPAGVRKDGKKSGSGFADNLKLDDEGLAANSVGAPQVLSGLDALFALQAVPDATADRKKALARGDQLLDRLEDLKRGILLGSVSREKLGDLARLAREGSQSVDDPTLRNTLQEIELRAQVELTKLQMRDA